MNNGAKILKCAVAVATVVVAATSQGAASNLPRLDSSRFTYRYDMSALPTVEDLDEDSYADFALTGSNTPELLPGAVRLACTATTYFNSSADNGSGGFWRKLSPTGPDGYTVEMRLRVQSQSNTYAMSIITGDSGGFDTSLYFKTNSLLYGHPDNNPVVIPDIDTTCFRTYRLVKMPGENRCCIWIDGALINDNLPDAISNAAYNRFLFGATGGTQRGTVIISYLRITKGAYAPGKSRGVDSIGFGHRYEMDSVTNGFSPTETTAYWTLTKESTVGGTSSLSGGTLSVSHPNYGMQYWLSTAPMDSSIVESSAFTFEIRTKFGGNWNNNMPMNILVGTPDVSCMFYLGPSNITWRTGSDSGVVINNDDNTREMHVFRITYDGYWYRKFTIWRDGVKIADKLDCYKNGSDYNFVRFGVTGRGSFGGTFDVDYVRWTTDGAFEPYIPPKGFVVSFL